MSKYAMFGKMKAHPGKRAELLDLLLGAAKTLDEMEGCEHYIIHEAADDEDTIWITELWLNEEAHAASLRNEQVLAVIGQARPLIAAIEPIRVRPVGGVGL
ncbi:antibiotic biosynthesis monooxygenase [Paenibacillus sp. D9]|uniref:putative quinol monooxygenase n=1 Tax=Paenibacillus TaxID=44249 RepID=UPI00061FC428|nr:MULTISPECIES: putative quinol monooxygenase [Paenibacillus]KKC49008.1 antibiotic biosynthesis monooxygenase [Paenibacillus sp. D9]